MRKKGRKEGLVGFSVTVTEEIYNEFEKQTSERGYKKYVAFGGALNLWLTLTPEEQNKWIEDKPKPESSVPSENEIYADLSRLADLVKDIDAKIKRSEAAKTRKTPRRRRSVGD